MMKKSAPTVDALSQEMSQTETNVDAAGMCSVSPTLTTKEALS